MFLSVRLFVFVQHYLAPHADDQPCSDTGLRYPKWNSEADAFEMVHAYNFECDSSDCGDSTGNADCVVTHADNYYRDEANVGALHQSCAAMSECPTEQPHCCAGRCVCDDLCSVENSVSCTANGLCDDPNDIPSFCAGGGAWGGLCICPDGTPYEVGDNNDACGSLACEGGVAGPCSEGGILPENKGKKVTCGQPQGYCNTVMSVALCHTLLMSPHCLCRYCACDASST
jgi:hypothetical protein